MMIANTQGTIWSRLIAPDRGDLSHEAAESLLRLNFDREDQERMKALLAKNEQGALSPAELSEAEEYRRAADLLALIHSKARRSLDDARPDS